MTVETNSEYAMKYAKELINYRQPSDRRDFHLSDQSRGLFLQPVSFGQTYGGKSDDEERHQPVFAEGAAKHVDDPFLPRLCEKWNVREYAFRRKQRKPCEQARDLSGDDDDHRGAQLEGKTDDDNSDAIRLYVRLGFKQEAAGRDYSRLTDSKAIERMRKQGEGIVIRFGGWR